MSDFLKVLKIKLCRQRKKKKKIVKDFVNEDVVRAQKGSLQLLKYAARLSIHEGKLHQGIEIKVAERLSLTWAKRQGELLQLFR